MISFSLYHFGVVFLSSCNSQSLVVSESPLPDHRGEIAWTLERREDPKLCIEEVPEPER